MKKEAFEHRVENKKIGVEHWQAIGKYFFDDSEVSLDERYKPKSLKEGLEAWQKLIERPDFKSTNGQYFEGTPIIMLMLDDLGGIIPECYKVKNAKVILLTNRTGILNGCQLVEYSIIFNELALSLFQSENLPNTIKWQLVAMVMHAITLRASKITIFTKVERAFDDCLYSSEYEFLGYRNSWQMIVYDSTQYWHIFAPENTQLFNYWLKTLSSYTNELSTVLLTKCRIFFHTNETKFSQEEIENLDSYLFYWRSDERESFFQVVDQLNFELAVRGYLSKLHAKLHRLWLSKLVQLGYYQLPFINKIT